MSQVANDISISDLGKLIESGNPMPVVVEPAKEAAPVIPATETPKEPPPADPKAPEAATVKETPVTEPEKKVEPEENTGETKKEPEQPNNTEEPKPKESWFDKRLSTISRQRREAEAQAKAEQEKREAAEREVERLKRELDAKAQPGPKDPAATSEPAKPAEGEPILEDYIKNAKEDETYEQSQQRWYRDYRAWERKQEAAEAARQKQADAEAQEKQRLDKDWDEAMEAYPDFEDAVRAVRTSSPANFQASLSHLRDDDGKAVWPQLVMHFYQHPQDLKAVSSLYQQNPVAAIAKLGRIAAGFSKTPEPVVPDPKPAAQTTEKKAPATPPTIIGSHQTPAPIDLEKADMNTFAREASRLLGL